jgi:catechol 2,3-dioxygenase-like lactoylglutathione lyase family enzyme
MTAARVGDLAASIRFYTEVMGFPLLERPAEDIAVVSFNGYPVLLAGPGAGDLTPHLNPVHNVTTPGGTLFVHAPDIDAQQAALAERHAPGLTRIEKPWGDIVLTVTDPDGYTISFWTLTARTPERTLELYLAGVPALEEALAGLREADLALRLRPGEWSIRQIVHHLADSEATALAQPKFALAEPGRLFIPNRYDPAAWASGLAYERRDIAPALALFAAVRGHLAQLLRELPGAWQRATVDPAGQERPVGLLIGMLVSHAYEHIEDIKTIRAAHRR